MSWGKLSSKVTYVTACYPRVLYIGDRCRRLATLQSPLPGSRPTHVSLWPTARFSTLYTRYYGNGGHLPRLISALSRTRYYRQNLIRPIWVKLVKYMRIIKGGDTSSLHTPLSFTSIIYKKKLFVWLRRKRLVGSSFQRAGISKFKNRFMKKT